MSVRIRLTRNELATLAAESRLRGFAPSNYSDRLAAEAYLADVLREGLDGTGTNLGPPDTPPSPKS